MYLRDQGPSVEKGLRKPWRCLSATMHGFLQPICPCTQLSCCLYTLCPSSPLTLCLKTPPKAQKRGSKALVQGSTWAGADLDALILMGLSPPLGPYPVDPRSIRKVGPGRGEVEVVHCYPCGLAVRLECGQDLHGPPMAQWDHAKLLCTVPIHVKLEKTGEE